jgi:hypothetical protein
VTWESVTAVDNAAVNAAIADAPDVTEAALGRTITNVKYFGAVGDGVTDDTVAINLASNSIKLTGGILYFPAGTYMVRITDNDTELPWGASAYPIAQSGPRPCFQVYSNTQLLGDGIDVTIIKRADDLTDGPMINLTAAENVIFRGFTLDGNRQRFTVNGLISGGESEGIDTKNDCRRLLFESLKITEMPNEGIDLDNVTWDLEGPSVVIRECVFYNIPGTGIHNANWSVIENCVFENCGQGRYLGAVGGYLGSNGSGAIDGAGHNCYIRNSYFKNCSRAVHIYRQIGETSHAFLGQATGTLTMTANPSVGETVTVGSKVYTWSGVGKNFTANAATNVFTSTAHGWADTTAVRFLDKPDGGLDRNVTYYVRDATADTFKLALSAGGTAIDIGSVTAGRITNDWPLADEVPLGATVNQTAINLAQTINGLWPLISGANVDAYATYAAPSILAGTPAVVKLTALAIGTVQPAGTVNLGNTVPLASASSNIVASGAFLTGGGLADETEFVISNSIITNCTTFALELAGNNNATIVGCRISGSTRLLSLGGQNSKVVNSVFVLTDNTTEKIAIFSSAAHTQILGCTVTGGNITFSGSASYSSVIGCSVVSAFGGVSVTGAGLQGIRIVGCYLETTGAAASGMQNPVEFLTSGQKDMTVSGNILVGGISGVYLAANTSAITGNKIKVVQTGAVYPYAINCFSNNCTISGNTIEAAATYGIGLSAAATGNSVTGNVLTGSQPLVNTGVNNTLSGNIGGVPYHTYRASTPEGAVTAPIGSTCVDTATGDVYRKTSGSGNTGWVTP